FGNADPSRSTAQDDGAAPVAGTEELEVMKYRGVVVPMITPFTPAGAIDEPAVGRIVEHLIGGRVAGIFPLGTTGEAASIHVDDRRHLVATVAKAVNRRAMV